MAGMAGLLLAPYLMALNFLLTYRAIRALLCLTALPARPVASFAAAYLFVSFFSLTDGVSEMALFKGLVVVALILAPATLLSWSLRRVRGRRAGQRQTIRPLPRGEATALNRSAL